MKTGRPLLDLLIEKDISEFEHEDESSRIKIVRGARFVEVRENRDVTLNLLFDHEHNLQERVLKEQFAS